MGIARLTHSKIYRNQMRPILKTIFMGTSVLSASNVIARFVSFFVVVLITHALSLYEYGVVTLVLAISGPALSIVNLGFDELVIADVARYRSEGNFGSAKRLLFSYYRMQAVILFLLLIAGFFGRQFLIGRYGPELQAEGIALVLYIIVQVARTSGVTILNTHKKFFGIAFLASLEPIVRLGIVGTLVFLQKLTPATTIYTYVGASALIVIVALPSLFSVYRMYRDVKISSEALLWNTILRHGKWQGAMTILSSFVGNIKVYLIKFFLSTEAVSIYAVAQSMYGAISSLIPLKTVMSPLLAERVTDIARLRLFVAKASKYTFLAYLVLMGLVVIAAPFMIHMFFPKYTASILIFELMALRYPLNTFSVIHPPILFAFREQRFLTLSSLVGACTLIIGSITLIPLWGLPGAVIESLITVVISHLFREFRLRKKYVISTFVARSLFVYDDDDRRLLAEIVLSLKRRFFRARPKIIS